MKKKITIVILLAIIGLSSFAQVKLDSGLVAYYPFNGNANDASGNCHNGTASNVVFDSLYGIKGEGIYANGINSIINFSEKILPQSGDLSISVWTKTNTTVVCGEYITENNYGQLGFGIEFYGGNSNGLKYQPNNGLPATSSQVIGNIATNDNQWHNITAVWSSGVVLQIYVDGVLDNQKFSSEINQGGLVNTYFLDWVDNNNTHLRYKGCMDELRIYNRALTQVEIDSLYHIQTGIKEKILNNEINIYPNPAINNLIIESPQAVIEITNIQGQIIKTFAITGNKTNIDVSAFPSGVYVVEVKTEKGISVNKFIKE
jgi:hypothetical protein